MSIEETLKNLKATADTMPTGVSTEAVLDKAHAAVESQRRAGRLSRFGAQVLLAVGVGGLLGGATYLIDSKRAPIEAPQNPGGSESDPDINAEAENAATADNEEANNRIDLQELSQPKPPQGPLKPGESRLGEGLTVTNPNPSGSFDTTPVQPGK